MTILSQHSITTIHQNHLPFLFIQKFEHNRRRSKHENGDQYRLCCKMTATDLHQNVGAAIPCGTRLTHNVSSADTARTNKDRRWHGSFQPQKTPSTMMCHLCDNGDAPPSPLEINGRSSCQRRTRENCQKFYDALKRKCRSSGLRELTTLSSSTTHSKSIA